MFTKKNKICATIYIYEREESKSERVVVVVVVVAAARAFEKLLLLLFVCARSFRKGAFYQKRAFCVFVYLFFSFPRGHFWRKKGAGKRRFRLSCAR